MPERNMGNPDLERELGLTPKSPEESAETKKNIITANTPEGKEITFDFEKIREQWQAFYKDHNLPELAENIGEMKFDFSFEQRVLIKFKARAGFNEFIIFPSIELQQRNLAKIAQETHRPIAGIKNPKVNQYRSNDIRIQDKIASHYPNNIGIVHRSKGKPYLSFHKNLGEAEEETFGEEADLIWSTLDARKETGLTFPEYLIFQGYYAERHKDKPFPHPESGVSSYLLDAELPNNEGKQRKELVVGWDPNIGGVWVTSSLSKDRISSFGARSQVIFEMPESK